MPVTKPEDRNRFTGHCRFRGGRNHRRGKCGSGQLGEGCLRFTLHAAGRRVVSAVRHFRVVLCRKIRTGSQFFPYNTLAVIELVSCDFVRCTPLVYSESAGSLIFDRVCPLADVELPVLSFVCHDNKVLLWDSSHALSESVKDKVFLVIMTDVWRKRHVRTIYHLLKCQIIFSAFLI